MSAMICPQCGTHYEGGNRFCTRDGASLVPEHPDDSLSGTVLAERYLVREKIGEGGMGEVYLAEHVRMKRKVAVKVMRKWLTNDAAAIGRFHREAENASQISHPNVAAVYDFGETSTGLVYLAMEYATGEPLTKVLEREGPIHHVRAADLVSQVAEALGAAHALGILHRDLKPDNVMVGRTRAGTDLVKLLDFGIARVMGRETQAFTTAGLIVGTPEWMSPEQISGDQLDARTDIYALGLMAFRMLVGEAPFPGATSQEVMMAKMTKAARRLDEARPDVAWPEALQAAFDRVLATDPGERYGEATHFAADFSAGAMQLPLHAEAEAYLQALNRRTMTPARGLGTYEGTPPYGVPTHETPARPRESFSRTDTPVVPTGAMTPSGGTAAGAGGTAAGGTVAGGTAPFVPPVSEAGAPGAGAAGPAEVAAMSTAEATGAITGAGAALETDLDATDAVPDAGTERGAPLAPESLSAASASAGAPAAAPPKRKLPLVPILGAAAALVTALVLFQGKGEPPAPVGAADSTVVADSAARDTAAPPAAAPASVAAALDSVSQRSRNSVFGVVRGATRASGFLADSSGIVLTAASAVRGDTAVRVFLDAGRYVFGRVVAVDTAGGLAALLIPTRHCSAACAPLALAADSVVPNVGDSVVAVYSPALLDRRRDGRGRITEATARRLSATLRLADRGAGSPVLAPNGAVLGVTRAATGSGTIAPAATARALLARARRERDSQRLVAIDSLPPSWPARAMAESAIESGKGRSAAQIDAFRAKGDGVEVLVNTPQVLRWRRAVVDSIRQNYDASAIGQNTFCGPKDEICDPLEQWGVLREYIAERRAVVVIQVAPDLARPPFIGERQTLNFRVGNVSAVTVTADGAVVPPIDVGRIAAVSNPERYQPPVGATTPQRNARARSSFAFSSVLVIVRPQDLLKPDGTPRVVTLTVADEARRNPITVAIPPAALQAVAADVGEFVRR